MPKIFAQNLLDDPHALHLPDHPSDQTEDEKYNPIRDLVEWKALARPFRKKDRSYFTSVAVLLLLFSPIAFFLGGMTLFLALLGLGFVVYVLNLVPPEEVDYKISTQGVTVGEHFYHWQELDSFWISQKDGHKILNLLTQYRFPGVLMFIIGDDKEEEIKRVVGRYLPFHEIAPKSLIEKWSDSLQKHFPLENPHR